MRKTGQDQNGMDQKPKWNFCTRLNLQPKSEILNPKYVELAQTEMVCNTHTHARTHTHTYACTSTHTHTDTDTNKSHQRIGLHASTRTQTVAHYTHTLHTHTYTHKHTHTHTHTVTHKRRKMEQRWIRVRSTNMNRHLLEHTLTNYFKAQPA